MTLVQNVLKEREGDCKVQVGPGSEHYCPGVPGSDRKKAFQQPCDLVRCMLRKDHSREAGSPLSGHLASLSQKGFASGTGAPNEVMEVGEELQ